MVLFDTSTAAVTVQTAANGADTVDLAMADLTARAKSQILSQASTALIAQANQSQQNVLSLLR